MTQINLRPQEEQTFWFQAVTTGHLLYDNMTC